MRFKKTIAFLLSLILAAGVFVPRVNGGGTAEAGRYHSLGYRDRGDGTYEIFAYYGGETEVTIPSEIDGVPVTRLTNALFAHKQGPEVINIPNTINSLSSGCFVRCRGLQAINVESGGVYSSVDGVLYGNNNTELIYVPYGKKIKEYTVPETITAIQNYAFYDCVHLETVNIGSHITENLRLAIIYSPSLKSINYSADNPSYTSVDGVVYTKNKRGLVIFPAGRRGSFTIPSFVEYIDENAFFGSRITSVVIPENVKHILSKAFYQSIGLSDVKIEGSQTTLSAYAFNDCSMLSSFKCPALGYLYKPCFYNCPNLTVYCPDGSNVEQACNDYGVRCVTDDTAFDCVRLCGDNRYETSIAIAEELREETKTEKFRYIVVASGDNYPDALSGGYLCYKKNAPMILVNDAYMEMMTDYIKQVSDEDTEIYVLGGYGAVSEQFEELMADYMVTRIAGADRYETNLAILTAVSTFNDDILVCSGAGYADCLSASAAKRPILLVPGRLLDSQKEYLNTLERNNLFYIVGGTGAVTGYVEDALKQYGVIKRFAGSDRYETSALVAKEFFAGSREIMLAYSQNFPDGLSAAPLAIKTGAPILLATNNKRSKVEYGKYVASIEKLKKAYVAGGPTLISDETANAIFGEQ